MNNSRAPSREESLLSIADAIRPPGSIPEIDSPDAPIAMRRGHSVSQGDTLCYLSPILTYTDDNQR